MEFREILFSGLGATVLGVLLTQLLKKTNNKKGVITRASTSTNTFNVNIKSEGISVKPEHVNTQDGGVVVDLGNYTKETINVLFVDDEEFKTVENLITAGFINTKKVKDIVDLDCSTVKAANVIFVDINGVGRSLFPKDEGLGLAEALKKKYKDKYIVIYSAQVKGDRFHKALKIVDDSISKNAEPYEFVNILENLIE